MALIVKKFGGPRSASPERIKNVARLVAGAQEGEPDRRGRLAMSGETDWLLRLSLEIAAKPELCE